MVAVPLSTVLTVAFIPLSSLSSTRRMSLETFKASIAVNTRYIMLIIF